MQIAYFQGLSNVLAERLAQARTCIRAAVCWFSDETVFEVLLERLRAGVAVELILEYDTQNMQAGRLDFRKFIAAGGALYGYREQHLMHHKFAIIDRRLLLSGSYNWTNASHRENLLVSDDPGLVECFLDEFFHLKACAPLVRTIIKKDIKGFQAENLFENKPLTPIALKKQATLGSRVWVIHQRKGEKALFPDRFACFDAGALTAHFWQRQETPQRQMLRQFINRLPLSADERRNLSIWAYRIRQGDFLFLRTKDAGHLALVQSVPLPSVRPGFGACRKIQWFASRQAGSDESVFHKTGLSVYRGSVLELLSSFGIR